MHIEEGSSIFVVETQAITKKNLMWLTFDNPQGTVKSRKKTCSVSHTVVVVVVLSHYIMLILLSDFVQTSCHIISSGGFSKGCFDGTAVF